MGNAVVKPTKKKRKPRKARKAAARRVPLAQSRARAVQEATARKPERPPGWLFPGEQTLGEQRIERIVDLMLAGQWWPGISHRQLAREWGVSASAVEHMAAEAHRHVRQMAADAPDFADMLLLMGRDLYGRCLTRQKAEYRYLERGKPRARVMVPDPDYSSAKGTLELLAKIAGVMKQKIEHTHRDAFERWTDEEIAHFLDTGERPEDVEETGGADAQPGD